jgi:hypothetical protein
MVSGMSKPRYSDYINSEAWAIKRAAFREAQPRPWRCYCCNRKSSVRRPLEVHHIRYDNLGNEAFNDLALVCLVCHGLIHNYLSSIPSEDATAIVCALRKGPNRVSLGQAIISGAKFPMRPMQKAARSRKRTKRNCLQHGISPDV